MLRTILQQMKAPPALHMGEIAVDYFALLAKYLPEKLYVICDIHTRALLPADLPCPVLCFDTSPKATVEAVQHIRAKTAQAEALVAVGSGTLNDLTKYASFLDGKPYAVIATAPSMNGYVSANASISENGHKHTLAAHAPKAVLADMPTLAAAPLPLIQAGIGDTLCRSTVQADWLLSHLFCGTDYEPMYFEWMKEGEEKLLSSCQRRLASSAMDPSFRWDDGFIEQLFTCLLISGLAMQHCGSSMPASQGEHLIAHARELLFPELPSHFHGLEIAVTTLTMSRIQDTILYLSHRERSAKAQPETGEGALPHSKAAAHLLTSPDGRGVTDFIRQQINAIRLPTATLEAALKAAGCPTTPAELGWPEEAYATCIAKAPTLRDRFTFLNLQSANF